MPAAMKSAARTAGRSQHDELDNYGVDDFSDDFSDDPFATPSPPSKNKRKSEAAGLGIDEEVDVKKKTRQPTVKLDEERLLSDAGLPTLRRRAQGLKFKGKGHEFSDMTRLLSFYQRWLDDLYPKARFLDALAMVEKAGHKKRLADARKAWREENDPNRQEDKEEDAFELEDRPDTAAASLPERPSAGRLIQGLDQDRPPRPRTPTTRDHPDEEDLYDVTPRAARGPRPGLTAMQPDAPDDDDLDALMAEAEDHDGRPAAARTMSSRRPPQEDGDDDLDDLIAEAEEQDARPKSIFGNPSASKPAATDWDDDEAALREMEGF